MSSIPLNDLSVTHQILLFAWLLLQPDMKKLNNKI